MTTWKLYRNTINRNCLVDDNDLHGLDYWRNNLFATIMTYCLPLALLSAIPCCIVSFLSDKILLGAFDVVALGLIFLISFNKTLNIHLRKTLFITVLYILSVVLIYYLGSLGPGLLYLLLITIFCVLIFSTQAAYLSIGINTLICLAFTVAIYFNVPKGAMVQQYSVASWLAISANLLGVTIVVVLLLPLIFNSLYKSNERYEMVAKATSDIICDWDIEKDITRYSDSIYAMFGYDPAKVETSAKWWWGKVHPDDKERVDQAVLQSLEGSAKSLYIEYRFQCADGSYKHILDRAYILRDANKKAIRVIGAMQDIQQMKEREQWLKLMESVITNANDAVLIVEADGPGKNGPHIVFANEAYVQMTGYCDKEELMNLKPRSLHGPDPNTVELQKIKKMIDVEGSYQGEIITYRKNGEAFWNNKTISPVRDEKGKLTHWISIERDVTERHNYVKAIEDQNKKLKEISWMQSHIVRAPLTRIMGLVNLLSTIPPDSVDIHEVLEYIMISAHEFDDIVKDIIKNAEIDLLPE